MRIRDRIVELRRVPAGELLPNPRNWRTHPAAQADAMRGVLAEVGFADAVLARQTDAGLMLIDGHLRAEVAPESTVPVLVLDVDEAEADLILATHDPLASMATVDGERLTDLLGDVRTSNEALAGMLQDLGAGLGGEVEEDEVPEVPEDPVTRLGDVWVLGDHRLVCGDATSAEDVRRLLAGAVPFLMVTDPPYGVNYSPEWRDEAAKKGHLAFAGRRVGKVPNAGRRVGKVPNDDRVDWSEAYLLFPGDVAYTWSPPGDHVILTGAALQKSGFEIRNQIVWKKSHIPISRGAYSYQHEPCWYGVRRGHKAKWTGNNMASTVWDVSLDKNVAGGHSTQKPVEIMARPIRNHGGDAVYDPFVGSGTTLIAAEQLGRRCYAMELEPRYCDVVVQRWQNLTGGKARRENARSKATSNGSKKAARGVQGKPRAGKQKRSKAAAR